MKTFQTDNLPTNYGELIRQRTLADKPDELHGLEIKRVVYSWNKPPCKGGQMEVLFQ
jgi:hypothetical protein